MTKLNYYKELDGVRAVAALLVMLLHFFNGNTGNSFIALLCKKVFLIGEVGVTLFFVLSGFLITRILLVSKHEKNYFSYFYIRRTLRIFPLYYLFLIIYYLLMPFLIPINSDGGIYYWFYLQDLAITFQWITNGPIYFWSLAVEEHFYLFWPLIIWYFKNKQIVFIVFAILLLAFFVRLWLLFIHKEPFYFTFSRIDELSIGALLAIQEAEKKWTIKSKNKFLLIFVCITIPFIVLFTKFSGLANPVIQVVKFIFMAFASYGLIGYIINANKDNLLKKILKSKPFLFTGKISYGLYVYHSLCFTIMDKYFPINSLGLRFLISFSFCFIIASLSYYLFERFFLKLKLSFSY